jgi:hypothetical protein
MDTVPGRLQAPYMLDDIVANAQRISARLPPNEWEPDALFFGLRRDASGLLDLVRLPRMHFHLYDRLIHNVVKPSTLDQVPVARAGDGSEDRAGWLKRVAAGICKRLRRRRKKS